MELGSLDKEAECAVLHDWLTKDGKATGNTTAWIDAISQETYGWAQHILSCVGPPALDQLHANNGVVSAVLEAGRTGWIACYKQWGRCFFREQLHCIARSIADIPAGSRVDHTIVISSLSQDYEHNETKRIPRSTA